MGHPWEGSWTINKPLGNGGQGVTRLVSAVGDGSNLGVLKCLKNNRSMAARARMRREVASLQSLAAIGARVPQVLDHNTETYAEKNSELFLVMSFVEGSTLKEFVESFQCLPVDQAIEFTLGLCDIVKVAHTEGVLHRDIKPDNIIVNSPSRQGLFIVDYGLSFNTNDDDLTETAETFRNKFLDLPETNTPGGDRRDPRSDITALSAIFYYLLTGHHAGHLQDSSGRLPHLRPGYAIRELVSDPRTPQIELFLSRGLSPALQNRFQDIDEFASRLETLAGQGADIGEIDPVRTAAELSMQLRQLDRKTQLMEFRPKADELLNKLTEFVNAYGRQLGLFKVYMSNGGNEGPILDGNLDKVTGVYTQAVDVEHHGRKRERLYRVASRQEQCVVVACECPRSQKNKFVPEHWRELAWYDDEITDVLPLLQAEFKQWLNRQLQEVAAELLSESRA